MKKNGKIRLLTRKDISRVDKNLNQRYRHQLKNKHKPKQSYLIYKARVYIKYTRAQGRYCKIIEHET